MGFGRLFGSIRATREAYRPIAEVRPYLSRFAHLPFVLVHVPKNGGTSILDAIGTPRPRVHATAWEMRSLCADLIGSRDLVAVWRDPVARFGSAWRYFLSGGNGGRIDRVFQRDLQRLACRSHGISADDLKDVGRRNRAFWPQSRYLLDPYGELCVDVVLRLESLSDDLEDYCSSVGVEVAELQRVNVSEGADIASCPVPVELVRSLYASDDRLAADLKLDVGPRLREIRRPAG